MSMVNMKDFFSYINTVESVPKNEREQLTNHIEAVKAFARASYKSIYVIDYQRKGFEYVSDNPLFLCGHTAEEVMEMGYLFYINNVSKTDLDLLVKINDVGFEFYEKIPIKERKEYTISYDFHIKHKEGKAILINQKLTPLFLTESGKIWKAICIVSLSAARNSGNIKIYRKGNPQIYTYNLEGNFWKANDKIKLSGREKEILQLAARGYTISEVAESLFVSPETVKFHRRKMFNKLEVSNISEAIAYATNNKLI